MIALVREPIVVERCLPPSDPSLGGFVLFLGTVRGVTDAEHTEFLEYSAHEPMALAQMERIAAEAKKSFGAEVVIVHRLGRLEVGEIAVLTAAATPHREQAFSACRFLIDSIKRDVPIWKKEAMEGGAFWVEGDTRVRPED